MNLVIVRLKSGQAFTLQVENENTGLAKYPLAADPAPYRFAELVNAFFGDALAEEARVIPTR